MNKDEFLRQLEVLLSGISQEERTEALAFYRSYFEDAGEANEAKILEELESPQKVADSIIKDWVCSPGKRVLPARREHRQEQSGIRAVQSALEGAATGAEWNPAVQGVAQNASKGVPQGAAQNAAYSAPGEGWNAGMGDRSSGHHFAGVAGNDSGHTVSIARHCGGAVWNCNSGCGSHGRTVNLRCGALWCRNRNRICRKSCNRNRAYGRRTHRPCVRCPCGGSCGLDFRRISSLGIERNLEALQKAI